MLPRKASFVPPRLIPVMQSHRSAAAGRVWTPKNGEEGLACRMSFAPPFAVLGEKYKCFISAQRAPWPVRPACSAQKAAGPPPGCDSTACGGLQAHACSGLLTLPSYEAGRLFQKKIRTALCSRHRRQSRDHLSDLETLVLVRALSLE